MERDGLLDMGGASRCVDVRAMGSEGLLRGAAEPGSRTSPSVVAEDGEDTNGPYGSGIGHRRGNAS